MLRGHDTWLAWLLPVLFAAPWLLGAAWVYVRGPRSRDEVPASMGELARRRLDLR